MKLITLVIFLTVSATSYGLSCVTMKDPLIGSLEDFDYEDFMDQLKKLPTNEDEDDDICRVELILNYAEQLLTVKFTGHIVNDILIDEMIQFDTVVTRSSANTEDFKSINFLEYACSENGCEIQFISDHITWLLTSEFIELKKKIGALLIGNGIKTEQCFINRTTATICPSQQCVAFSTQEKDEETMWEHACAGDQNYPVSLQITNTFHYSEIVVFQLYMRCEYDKCNSMDILNKAMLIVHEEHSTSSLLEALDYSSSTKLLSSSSTQTQQSSSSSTTSPHRNNSTTTIRRATTLKGTGQQVQSYNAMIYLVLLIFMAHPFF